MHDIGGLEYCHGRTLRIMVWFNFLIEKIEPYHYPKYCHGRTLRIMVWFNFFNEKTVCHT